jgi:uncharacterized SAM-binding protein YcdF (DUF218 family)
MLWLLSCQAVAIWLALNLLPQVSPVSLRELQDQHVQAIVVLGGGVESNAPEYNDATLSPDAMMRLLFGVYLSRISNLPMAYTGGRGWSGPDDQLSEADVAALALSRIDAPSLRWRENLSRDTHENAINTAAMLQRDGIVRIALITNAWHMPRSLREFEHAGFEVTPAPMGYVQNDVKHLLQWLPSGKGLRDSAWVLRECLGLWIFKVHQKD